MKSKTKMKSKTQERVLKHDELLTATTVLPRKVAVTIRKPQMSFEHKRKMSHNMYVLQHSPLATDKWLQLPLDVWSWIFATLQATALYSARCVCSKWRLASQSPLLNYFWVAPLVFHGPKVMAPTAIHDATLCVRFKCNVKKGKCQTVRHYSKDAPRTPVFNFDNKIPAYVEFVEWFGRKYRTKLQSKQLRDKQRVAQLEKAIAERTIKVDSVSLYIDRVVQKKPKTNNM